MKCFVRSALFILSISWFALPLSAKEFLDLEAIKTQAAEATNEKYPDSDEVLLNDYIQVEYQSNGTSDSWDDTAVKILTEKGKRNNRTMSLGFDVAYGTNYFSKVQLIKPDGSVQELDPAANSHIMVDPGQMSANIYNPNSKVLELSVPGLEIGDTLRYVIRRQRHKTVVPDSFSDYQTFESTMPMEKMTYEVIAPKDRPLVKTALKSEIEGTVKFSEEKSEQSGKIVYTWEIQDVPRMFPEPDMPTAYTVVQRLMISTMESWEDLSKWYWELCLPRLESTPEMEAKANELVADANTTQEKINAVFNFVSQDIRYMGITTEDEAPGYEPHDVSITFENRYGVCRDKAALLAAMLRIVDVEAFPVIIMAGPKKDEEVPQPFFNHAVTAALGDDGEYILMDSTDENTKDIFPTYLQNMSYIVARPEGETLLTSPIISADDNLLKITSAGSLDKNGNLEAKSSLVFEGINDTVYRGYFSKIKPEERRRFFEGQIKRSMPTAEVQSVEILPKELRDTTQPLSVNLTYSAENLLIEGDANNLLVLPKLGSSLGYANFLIGQTGLEKRKYPLYTRMTAGVRETLKLTVPDDIGTINIPEYDPIKSDELIWNIQVAQTGGILSATNTFLMNAVEFTPEQYLVLKESLKDIEYNSRKKLILDKAVTQNIDSDVRILERHVDIKLEGSGKWTETSRSKVEILTYAGTKNYSEIKLSYNPAWQTIELTKAIVTSADGTVKEISEEEMNIMDAGWVASAPRYPAEKLLVANLPGVEVGSVLEYEFVSKVDGKPFFSNTHTFNGFEPMDQKTLTVSAPESLTLNVLNKDVEESKTASNGTVTYTWTSENQPGVKKEEALPAWHTFNPAVFLSTSDWKTYGNEVEENLVRAAKGQAESKKRAKQLTKQIKTDREKAVILRDWVAKNIRPAGPGLTSLPLTAITAADTTLTDRYGNNSDRMVLLYTLLKSSGLKPEFVLAGSGLSKIREAAEPKLQVPSRGAFGTVLVKVQVDGEPIYFNGSSQYAELGVCKFDKYMELNLKDGSVSPITVNEDKTTRSHLVYGMTLKTDGELEMTKQTLIQGPAFEGFHQRYAEITPENRRRHYLELVAGVSQSAKATSDLITDYEVYPGNFEYSVAADRYAVVDGDFLYFTIPGSLGGIPRYRSNERTLPLSWNNHVDSLTEYRISLPEGYEPTMLPKSFAWQAPNDAGTVEITIDWNETENLISIVQNTALKPALIQAADFPQIIEASKKLSHPNMRTVLLKKKK